MPRPLSWLPRVAEIRRTVEISKRSHWERRELGELFQLQPRAVQNLMEGLPMVEMGRSRLAERGALLELLDRVARAADENRNPGAEVKRSHTLAEPRPRRLRDLVPHHHPAAAWDALPSNLDVSPGRLSITFERLDDLVRTLLDVSALLDADLEECYRRWEPSPPDTLHRTQLMETEQVRGDLRRFSEETRCLATDGSLVDTHRSHA